MNHIEQAYLELYPEGTHGPFSIEYNRRLKTYNANIRMRGKAITIHASTTWKEVSPEIQKGLFQELFVRLLKTKKHTIHMDLYHNFIRSLPKVAPKKHDHPIISSSFQRVNEKFFNGMMNEPNLREGKGINRLGTYEYATDTVTISSILFADETLMDYVMYHELLHKKHQYVSSKGRSCHHSKEFLAEERKFPHADFLERQLPLLVRKHKQSWFW